MLYQNAQGLKGKAKQPWFTFRKQKFSLHREAYNFVPGYLEGQNGRPSRLDKCPMTSSSSPPPPNVVYFLLKAYFSDGLRPEKKQRLLAFTYWWLWPERKWWENPGTFSLTAFAYFSQDTRAPSYTPSLRTCLQTTYVGDDIILHCVRLTSGSSQTASEGTSESISVFVILEKSFDDGLGKWWILSLCAVRRLL